MAVSVEWLGHCCFRLSGDSGPRILIDPFDETIGLHVPPFECDILLISHGHYDSAARHLVPPPYELVDSKGTTIAGNIAFNAFPWWHDQRQGKDFGSVLIFVFELEGMKIGYLSHIGAVPRQWVYENIQDLDIMFLPVGGIFTLGASDASYLAKQLKPKLIIPMHFKLPWLSFTLGPLSDFTRLMPDALKVDDWNVLIPKERLPETPTVLLMRHWPGVEVH